MRLIIISCGSKKRSYATEAANLYTGCLFRAAREYAEKNGDAYLIASAEHGLLRPDDVVEPYDKRLPKSADGRRQWSSWCQADLARWLLDNPGNTEKNARGFEVLASDFEVEILAGKEYAELLQQTALGSLGDRLSTPLEGLGVGQRLQWFKLRRGSDDSDSGQLRLFAA